MTTTEEQIRDYARTVALAAAVNTGDEIEIAQVLDDELRVSLADDDLTRVYDALTGAVIVVVFPDELEGTEDATPGPWETVANDRATLPGFVGVPLAVRSLVPMEESGVPAAVAGFGHGIRNPADTRLIVALRNAYQASTEYFTADTETTEDE